jgi:hypothetical protein
VCPGGDVRTAVWGAWTWHLTARTVACVTQSALGVEWDMPKFMDFHDGLKLSPADIEELRSKM